MGSSLADNISNQHYEDLQRVPSSYYTQSICPTGLEEEGYRTREYSAPPLIRSIEWFQWNRVFRSFHDRILSVGSKSEGLVNLFLSANCKSLSLRILARCL